MKKLATLAALAALALPVIATEVTSSNVVGYNKLTLNAGYNLIGSQFVNIGGTTKNISQFIDTNKSNNTLPGVSATFEYQTTLRVWTGTGYTTYGWFAAEDDPDWGSKWADVSMENLADFSTPVGTGYWIYTPTQSLITFVGEVPAPDSVSGNTKVITLNAGYNLVSNPFPSPLNIQNIQSEDLPGVSATFEYQTTLRVWTGTGYTTYGWFAAEDDPDWGSKWADVSMENLADITFGVGEGFWIYTPSAATVTFSK